MNYYSPNAIALDTNGHVDRLFTYGHCQNRKDCKKAFENWEKNYGYKFLSTWILVTDENGKRVRVISHKTYPKNFWC